MNVHKPWHWLSLRNVGKRMFSGSVLLFGGLMLGNAIAYLYHVIIARMLPPTEYGALVTLLSISYVLAVLMRTFQAWVIKAVTEADQARGRQLPAVFTAALRTFVPLGVAAFLAHWLTSGWVAQFLHLESATPLIVLGLFTFSSFMVPIPRGLLLGIKWLRFTALICILDPSVRVLTGVALVTWGFHVNGALASFAIGNMLAFAVALLPLWPLLKRGTGEASSLVRINSLDRYTLLVLIINSCLAGMVGIDQIAVKHFFSEDIAGNYAVAFLLGQIITMSALSLSWVVFARAATMPLNDPRHGRLLIRGLQVIGVITLALTAGYLTVPALAVQLMGGAQYTTAHTYVGLIGIETALFAFVYIQAYYHISIKQMQVIWPLCFGLALEIVLLLRFHDTVEQVLLCMIGVMGALLVWVSGLSWWILRANRRLQVAVIPSSTETMAEIS